MHHFTVHDARQLLHGPIFTGVFPAVFWAVSPTIMTVVSIGRRRAADLKKTAGGGGAAGQRLRAPHDDLTFEYEHK